MTEECNGKPVWSKQCDGVSSGGKKTNTCYIYQAKYGSASGWSLSPGKCDNAWMTTCQMFSNNDNWKCENHPKNQDGMQNFEQAGWPWEEKRWVNNWWNTVEMSCVAGNDFIEFLCHIIWGILSFFLQQNGEL